MSFLNIVSCLSVCYTMLKTFVLEFNFVVSIVYIICFALDLIVFS